MVADCKEVTAGVPAAPPPPYSNFSETDFCIHISNVAPEATVDAVKEFFAFCGPVETVVLEPSADCLSQYGAVSFASKEHRDTALLLHDAVIAGRPISVSESVRGMHGAEDASECADVAEAERKHTVIATLLAHGYVLGAKALAYVKDVEQRHQLCVRAEPAVKKALSTVDLLLGAALAKAHAINEATGDPMGKLNSHAEPLVSQGLEKGHALAQRALREPVVARAYTSAATGLASAGDWAKSALEEASGLISEKGHEPPNMPDFCAWAAPGRTKAPPPPPPAAAPQEVQVGC